MIKYYNNKEDILDLFRHRYIILEFYKIDYIANPQDGMDIESRSDLLYKCIPDALSILSYYLKNSKFGESLYIFLVNNADYINATTIENLTNNNVYYQYSNEIYKNRDNSFTIERDYGTNRISHFSNINNLIDYLIQYDNSNQLKMIEIMFMNKKGYDVIWGPDVFGNCLISDIENNYPNNIEIEKLEKKRKKQIRERKKTQLKKTIKNLHSELSALPKAAIHSQYPGGEDYRNAKDNWKSRHQRGGLFNRVSKKNDDLELEIDKLEKDKDKEINSTLEYDKDELLSLYDKLIQLQKDKLRLHKKKIVLHKKKKVNAIETEIENITRRMEQIQKDRNVEIQLNTNILQLKKERRGF